ncbi:MAG: hypothetical protein ACOX75_03200 [Lachnospiraceae bacterium]|jgi:hypothetical protein
MKSKVWSVLCVVSAAISFLSGISAFLVASIMGRINMSDAATYNYILTGIGLVFGILACIFGSIRTPFKRSVAAGFANLAKISIMVSIIVLFATFANIK